MATTLTYKIRKWLDSAVPFMQVLTLQPGNVQVHRFSDLFLPYLAWETGAFCSPGAALNLNITAGFFRDSAGNIVEAAPQTNALSFTAPASGKQTIYTISFDPVAKAYNATAGVTANVGSGTAGAVPAGQIAVATVDIRNGDTSPAQSRIDNTQRMVY
jgi:hypothetical protein